MKTNRRGDLPLKNYVIGNRPIKNMEDTTMSEEKKPAVTEEVKEEVRELSSEELGRVTGGTDYAPRQWKETLLYILKNRLKKQK